VPDRAALPKSAKLVATADAKARAASGMQMGSGHAMPKAPGGHAIKDPVDSLQFGTPQPQPKGVKTFMSDYAAGDYSFKRKLTVPGTYTFMCELHEGMTMKVVVKR
jgi:plastocyanin